MADFWAKKHAADVGLGYLDMLWHTSRLSYSDDARFSNKGLSACEHVKEIFKDTRVMDKDPDFVMQVCKRTKDAVSNHPVLVVGPWRQGKSSLVNSLIWEESKKKKLPEHLSPARTGRRSRVTSKVDLYGPIEDAEVGNIWLADTPGLEPDEQHDIMGGLRHELVRRGVSVAVFTDILVLVIAGTAQGMSTLSSNHFMDWIKDTYAKARETSSLCCTILPVVTHGDQIDADEQSGDIECVMQRLAEIAAVPEGRAVACQAQTLIQEPFIVTNHKLHHSGALLRNGEGKNIGAFLAKIRQHVREQCSSHEFRLQWSHYLTEDLEKMVNKFHAEHPDEETERRLFHRTLESILATYNKKPINLQSAFPKPAWSLLPMIERELRGEPTWQEKRLKSTVALLPCPPSQAAPVGVVVCLATAGGKNT